MQHNRTNNETQSHFTNCLGIYHLLSSPTGKTLNTYIAVIITLAIFSLLSAVGNGLIIYVYVKQKSLQRTNILLLVCLAFLDFVSAMVLEPLYIVRLFSEIFGFTTCVYVLIVRRLFEYLRPVSFMTLALITIERYLALFKAISHRKMVTKRRLVQVILIIWFIWFLIILIRSFLPTITSVFYTVSTFVAFSLLLGNLIMYFKIGKLARLHSRPTKVSTVPTSLTAEDENRRSIDPRLSGISENSVGRQSDITTAVYSKTEDNPNYIVNKLNVKVEPLESTVEFPNINDNPNLKLHVSKESSFSRNEKEDKEATVSKLCNNNSSRFSTQEPSNNNISESIKSRKVKEKTEHSLNEVKNTTEDSVCNNFNEKPKDTGRKTKGKLSKKTTKLMVETRERNATRTVFYIVAVLTICYLPISVLLVYLSFKQKPDATLLFIYLPIADTIALFNALVNPFIYCYKNRKMRIAVKNVLQKRSTL